ncbi:MAG: DUF3108 domain-containing protein [Candidatus Eisenbacteria bacterium]
MSPIASPVVRRQGRPRGAALLAVALGLVAGGLLVRPGAAQTPSPTVVNKPELRARGVPFGPGESLRFSIEYGLVKAGTAWLEVGPMETYKGRPCYHLTSRAESNRFMSRIYKVRDRIDSLIDAEGLYSWRYKKRQREGGYERDFDILYDPPSGRARYSDGSTLDGKPYPKDGLAAFYFIRHMPLEVGKDIAVVHHSDRRSGDILVKVHKKETVTVPAGTFECFVIEPVMEEGGLFKSSGRLTIWVTADARRIPVLMKSKIPVGSVDAILQEIKTGAPIAARP